MYRSVKSIKVTISYPTYPTLSLGTVGFPGRNPNKKFLLEEHAMTFTIPGFLRIFYDDIPTSKTLCRIRMKLRW